MLEWIEQRKGWLKSALLILCCFLRLSILAQSPSEIVERVNAFLLIKDHPSALELAKKGLLAYPFSKPVWDVYVKSQARSGEEKEMMKAWSRYLELFPEEQDNQHLIETLAWGVIEKAIHSPSPLIRSIAHLAAYFSEDAKGVQLLSLGLVDDNSLVRKVCVNLTSNLKDYKLKKQILSMYNQGEVWDVRLELIKAMGNMKIVEAKEELLALIGSDKKSLEEKQVGIQALLHLFDNVDRQEIERLAKSERAGLRLLACQLVSHFEMAEQLDLILPLLQDHRSEIRAATLHTLGCLRLHYYQQLSIADLTASKLSDLDPNVAISAAWVLTLLDAKRGQKAFESWLIHPTQEVRITAAAALTACGKYSYPLIEEAFKQSKDHYVRMNLALGMIGQRINIPQACDSLSEGLCRIKERWNWSEEGPFRALVPSKAKLTGSLHSPETINQLVRLEILNILAILRYPKTQEAIRKFLKEKAWGITSLASALLLTEGDEEALTLVHYLLQDSDKNIRIQAALVLAEWGGGEEALKVLEASYGDADRELKERILEGVFALSSKTSLPFLLERLKDSSQSIRILAAAGLLRCLYH